jgi:uncharacterized membrane protein YhaH (DUF805 family)
MYWYWYLFATIGMAYGNYLLFTGKLISDRRSNKGAAILFIALPLGLIGCAYMFLKEIGFMI